MKPFSYSETLIPRDSDSYTTSFDSVWCVGGNCTPNSNPVVRNFKSRLEYLSQVKLCSTLRLIPKPCTLCACACQVRCANDFGTRQMSWRFSTQSSWLFTPEVTIQQLSKVVSWIIYSHTQFQDPRSFELDPYLAIWHGEAYAENCTWRHELLVVARLGW